MSYGVVRSAVAVVGGVLLSFILVVLAGAALVRTPEMHMFFEAMREGQAGRLPPGGAAAALAAMDITDFRMRWMIGPAVAAVVGVFVGFVGKVRVWQMGMLAAMPYASLFSGSWSSSASVMFSVLYVGVAGLAAWMVCQVLRMRASRDPEAFDGV